MLNKKAVRKDKAVQRLQEIQFLKNLIDSGQNILLNAQDYKLLYKTDQVLEMEIPLSCSHIHATGEDASHSHGGTQSHDLEQTHGHVHDVEHEKTLVTGNDTTHSAVGEGSPIRQEGANPRGSITAYQDAKLRNREVEKDPAAEPLIQHQKLGIFGKKLRRQSLQQVDMETLIDMDQVQEISPKYMDSRRGTNRF
jgi:hypothetical protein